MRPDMRSPYETMRSRVRRESSPSIATPSSVRSSSSSSETTSLYAGLSLSPSVSAVSACSWRITEMSTLPSAIAMSAAASRLLVVLPIAEQTACGFSPSSIRLVMMLHTSVIRSASRTDEPPNFITVFSTVEEPVAPAAAFGSSVAVIMILEGVRTAEGVRRRPEATERRERAISTAEEVPIAMQSGWNQHDLKS